MSDMKPCPCCGSEKIGLNSGVADGRVLMHFVECLSCGMRTSRVYVQAQALDVWNTRGGIKPAAASPPPEEYTFRILCQQYVEEVGEFTVEAESLGEALAKAQAASLWEACGDTWKPGDDAQDADIYAVLTEDGTMIWER